MKQVDKDHYNFVKYCHFGRWASYFYQIKEILSLSPMSVLEVGVGDKVLGDYLKKKRSLDYKSVDIAEDLNPDFVGSILKLPAASESFDLVCSFEVMEHLEFGDFERALMELGRVSKKYVVVSLPHFGPPVKFLLKIPLLREMRFAFKFFWPQEHIFNGEHYWEIGKRHYSQTTVEGFIKKHFKIINNFVPFENQYHHFYILEKK